MICYKLDKNIDGNKILQDIQKLISKNSNIDNKEIVLVISIKQITNHSGDSLIPKLEYKE
jgi:hypothetical protein